MNTIEVAKRGEKFTGSLFKKIDPDEAPALWLRGVLALPPSEDDIAAHIQSEERARWLAIDKHFGLDSAAIDIAERRAKRLIAHDTGIDVTDPRWWERVATTLARRHVPGFSVRNPMKKKKHGAPREWTDERRAQLIADIEYLRKTSGKSIREICKILRRQKGYSARWGRETAEALRKEYGQAKSAPTCSSASSCVEQKQQSRGSASIASRPRSNSMPCKKNAEPCSWGENPPPIFYSPRDLSNSTLAVLCTVLFNRSWMGGLT
jgi:hypothetical protein